MMASSLRKTAVAVGVAGMLAATGTTQANVVNFSWRGAFTFLNYTGQPMSNSPSDYVAGYYANGDSTAGTGGAPYFPANVAPGADCTTWSPACVTNYGWYGNRTPVSGTLSFDTSTGAGVGTINPFFFWGDTPGSGPYTSVGQFQNVTFQVIDTIGTILGSMLFSWNGLGHSVSIVLDGSGLFANMLTMITNGPTSTVSGVGALPASNGVDFDPSKNVKTYPLGPIPVATKSLNTGAGCDGLALATQVNAYSIVTNLANVGTCTTGMVDDGVGGDPMTSYAIPFNMNFDLTSVHLDYPWQCLSCPPPPVPVPPAAWLFGSGLLGLIGLARRRRGH